MWMDGARGLSDTRGTTGILGDGGFGERIVMGLLKRRYMYKPRTFLEPFCLFIREYALYCIISCYSEVIQQSDTYSSARKDKQHLYKQDKVPLDFSRFSSMRFELINGSNGASSGAPG